MSSTTSTLNNARPLTETERNWLWAGLIVLGATAVFWAIYALELDMGRWDPALRLVLNPAETSMRYLGFSHFLVAFLFLTTSKKMRTPRSWIEFSAALAVGAVLCLGYTQVRLWSPAIATILFFLYFLVHDFRDQVFFYFSNGDAPPRDDRKGLGELLFRTPFLFFAFVAAAGALLLASGRLDIGLLGDAFAGSSAGQRWAVGIVFVALAGWASWRYRALWRREHLGRLADFARANRPILAIFAAAMVILFAQKGFAIVTLHFTCWYVFAMRQFKKRGVPATPPPRFSWNWLRATPAGFNFLHIGSAVLLLGVGAVWAYGFRNDPAIAPLRILLDPLSFRYWTIVHITASFAGR